MSTTLVEMLPALYAMRILVDGLISAAEADARPPAPPVVDGCPHPAARQVDASVLGGPPAVVCLECGRQRVGVVA